MLRLDATLAVPSFNQRFLNSLKISLRDEIYNFIKNEENLKKIEVPTFNNIDFWFSKNASISLAVIKTFIEKIEDIDYRRFFCFLFQKLLANAPIHATMSLSYIE